MYLLAPDTSLPSDVSRETPDGVAPNMPSSTELSPVPPPHYKAMGGQPLDVRSVAHGITQVTGVKDSQPPM